MRPDRYAANHDKADAALMQGREEGAKVELGQPPRALSLTALICLQS